MKGLQHIKLDDIFDAVITPIDVDNEDNEPI